MNIFGDLVGRQYMIDTALFSAFFQLMKRVQMRRQQGREELSLSFLEVSASGIQKRLEILEKNLRSVVET